MEKLLNPNDIIQEEPPVDIAEVKKDIDATRQIAEEGEKRVLLEKNKLDYAQKITTHSQAEINTETAKKIEDTRNAILASYDIVANKQVGTPEQGAQVSSERLASMQEALNESRLNDMAMFEAMYMMYSKANQNDESKKSNTAVFKRELDAYRDSVRKHQQETGKIYEPQITSVAQAEKTLEQYLQDTKYDSLKLILGK